MSEAGEPAVLQEINAALQASDLSHATTLAREALAAGTLHPVLLNLRAFWFEGQGRDAEAFADLQRARMLAPEDIGICNALGLAHARSERYREAIECFDAVIALDPDFGPAYFNKGWVSEGLGELLTARDCHAHANRLIPASPDPLAGMAAIAVRLGDWPQAKAYASRALAIDSTHAIAIIALAAAERADGAHSGGRGAPHGIADADGPGGGPALIGRRAAGRSARCTRAHRRGIRRVHRCKRNAEAVSCAAIRTTRHRDHADVAALAHRCVRRGGSRRLDCRDIRVRVGRRIASEARVHDGIPPLGDHVAGTGTRLPFRTW